MSRKKMTILIIAIILVAIGVGLLIFYFVGKESRKAVYEELQSMTVEETSTKEPYNSPIDFDSLWAVNRDIYAWIEIDGTDIKYPIVQSAYDQDDDYYLDHTIEGAEGYPGSIYTQKLNKKDFTDFNTVIYGHDMDDGSMFAGLHNYADPEFFQNHRTIHIYQADKELVYTVFAAVVYNDERILSAYDNSDFQACRRFLRSVWEADEGQFADDIQVSEYDKIITLSTCIWDRPENRYLVVAVLTDQID